MIRALIFDFDGVILDTETAYIESFGDVHEAHGLAFDRPGFRRNAGHSSFTFDPWAAFPKSVDRAVLHLERKVFNRERDDRLPILPGVMALLDAARERGLPVGIASNSEHAHVDRFMTRLALRDRFSRIACREDVASPKPEPDLYRLVMNAFGVRGSEVIAFEDSHAGSLAATRAGAWVVAVPNPSTHSHDFGHVHLKVDSLANCTLDGLAAQFDL